MEPTLANIKRVIEQTVGAAVPQDDINLFESSIIDSVQSVQLLVKLEKAFGVKLHVLDFADNKKFTLKNISAAIARQLSRPNKTE